jgi:hypothetical protein
MANPSVNGTIPQSASLQSLLYVSPDTTGGMGAWDAKNSAFWPIIPASTGFTSVAAGTSGKNGIASPTGAAELIALDSTYNPASNPWNLSGLNWTIFLQFRANTNASTNILLNRDYQGYNTGGGGYYIWWSGGTINMTAEASVGGLAAMSSAGSACPLNHMMNVFFVCNNGVVSIYVYGTYSNGGWGTAGTSHLTFTTGSPAVRMPCLFSQPVASGDTTKAVELYIAACWTTALTTTEMQSFGTNETAVLAGSSYNTAFSFGPILTAAASTQANICTTGVVSSVAGTITTLPLKNNTGTLWASTTTITAWVYDVTNGNLKVMLTGLSTDASGVMSFSHATIAPSTPYRIVFRIESNASEGLATLTAA